TERIDCRLRETLGLNIGGEHMAQGGARQKFLLRGIHAQQSENQGVWLAHQWRLAPETDQLGGTFAENAGQGHAVKTARGRGGGCIEVSVAVEPKKAEVLVVAARTGEKRHGLDTI